MVSIKKNIQGFEQTQQLTRDQMTFICRSPLANFSTAHFLH